MTIKSCCRRRRGRGVRRRGTRARGSDPGRTAARRAARYGAASDGRVARAVLVLHEHEARLPLVVDRGRVIGTTCRPVTNGTMPSSVSSTSPVTRPARLGAIAPIEARNGVMSCAAPRDARRTTSRPATRRDRARASAPSAVARSPRSESTTNAPSSERDGDQAATHRVRVGMQIATRASRRTAASSATSATCSHQARCASRARRRSPTSRPLRRRAAGTAAATAAAGTARASSTRRAQQQHHAERRPRRGTACDIVRTALLARPSGAAETARRTAPTTGTPRSAACRGSSRTADRGPCAAGARSAARD